MPPARPSSASGPWSSCRASCPTSTGSRAPPPEARRKAPSAQKPMHDTDVIRLRLGRVEEMFETPGWDGGLPPERFEPGIDACIGELRSRRSKRPVRLELGLPAPRVDAETSTRLHQAVSRYCADRIMRNDRERRSARRDGYAALK